jgi:hypothetical protein
MHKNILFDFIAIHLVNNPTGKTNQPNVLMKASHGALGIHSMRVHRIISIVLAGWISLCLYGCTPKQPKVARLQLPGSKSIANTFTGMGSFNLQKRHGLGGWDKPAGPSEAELLQHLAASQAPSHPTQLRKGSH